MFLADLNQLEIGRTNRAARHVVAAAHLASPKQFYVVSPLFIVLYMRRKWCGICATIAAIIAPTVAMAWGTYGRGWSALTLDGSWVVKYSEVRESPGLS